jgi:4-hydroxybenzoate polyprenyltransferase
MEGKKMEEVHLKNIDKIRHAGRMVADEFINGGHLVGLSFAFIGLATMLIFDFALRWEVALMIYFVTVAVYGFDHYHDLKNDSVNSNARVKYIKRREHIVPFQLALFITSYMILLLTFGTLSTIILGTCILLLGISYSLYFKRFTKTIVGFKNIYVASTVSLGILFTTAFYNMSIPVEIMFFIGYIGISVFLNCSFCDIKDMESDNKQGLKTLPLLLGKQRFFRFLIIMNSLSLSVLGLLVYFQFIPFYFISLVGVNILWFIFIHFGIMSDVDYHRFSSKLLDSMEIYLFIFLFAGKVVLSTALF